MPRYHRPIHCPFAPAVRPTLREALANTSIVTVAATPAQNPNTIVSPVTLVHLLRVVLGWKAEENPNPGFPFSLSQQAQCTPVAVQRVRFSFTMAPASTERVLWRRYVPGQIGNCRLFVTFLTHLSVPACFLRQALSRSQPASTQTAAATPRFAAPRPRTAAW